MAAEKFFATDEVVYDYGQQSSATSACVRTHLYGSTPADWHGLWAAWQHTRPALVAGHTPLQRFCPPIALADTLTLLRDPLARCFSEYLHVQREQRYSGSFRAYFSSPGQINRQSRALSGVAFEALGAVGITERYQDSLRVINERYGWRLKHRKDNKARWFAPKLDTVSASDRAEFARLNADDLALYAAANGALDRRLALQQAGQPFVHGRWAVDERGQISGWAWWAGAASEQPVALELWRGGERLETQASGFESRPFKGHEVPRAGRVGFAFQSVVEAPLTAPSAWSVRVADTGQVLEGVTSALHVAH